jgi:Domain of unknown function (DUF6894)
MQLYFFDIITPDHVQHDFTGRRLAGLDDARLFAELIALDIECSANERGDTQIKVSDVTGSALCRVKVRPPE